MIAEADRCLLNIEGKGQKQEVAAELEMDVTELDEFLAFLLDPDLGLVFKRDGYIGTETTQEIYEGVNKKRQYQREWKGKKVEENETFEFENEEIDIENQKSETEEKSDEKKSFEFENKKVDIENGKSNSKSEKSNIDFEQTKLNKIKVNKNREEIVRDGYPPSSKSPPPSKEDKVAKRKQREVEFQQQLVPHVAEYTNAMIRAFYLYWSVPNKSGTKMKWEMEPTWDLVRRLNNWRNNSDKWAKDKTKSNQQDNETQPTTDQRILAKVRSNQQPAEN